MIQSTFGVRSKAIEVVAGQELSGNQKHLRLQEARRLMLSGSRDATTAALAVGYASPS